MKQEIAWFSFIILKNIYCIFNDKNKNQIKNTVKLLFYFFETLKTMYYNFKLIISLIIKIQKLQLNLIKIAYNYFFKINT